MNKPTLNHSVVEGNLSGMISAIRDAKNRSDSYLENIINNVPHSIIWKDHNSIFLGCNRVFAESAGFSDPRDLVGKTDFDMPWHEQARLYVLDDHEVITSGKSKLNIEEPQALPDGSTIILSTSKVPLLDERGKVVGVLAIYTDITAKKNAEKELLEAKERAEIANQVKSEFVATTSHELRTPLNAIMGMTQILLKKVSDAETKQMLSTILQGGSHLLGMITDILNFSKLEADKFELDKTTFSLKKCINLSLNHLGHLLEHRPDIKLESNLANDLPDYIVCDEKCLRQLLFNLIGNAIKFTQKGKITVTAKLLKQHDNNVTIQIDIIDTGIGIPDDKLAIIFERFTQLDATYDRRFGGTGLGLAISKRLINRMDGEIGVESREKQGSHFWITIPCQLATTEQIKQAQMLEVNTWQEMPGSTGSYSSLAYESVGRQNQVITNEDNTKELLLSNKLVVMIEDEKINQVVLGRMLNDLGTKPTIFSDAKSALTYFNETDQQVDIILTDIGLPDMNGTELIKHIRDNKKYKKTPILAVTGYSAKDDIKKIISAGANEVLNKPISSETLENTLDRYLNGGDINIEPNVETHTTATSLSALNDKTVFDYDKTLEQHGGNLEIVKILLKMLQEELPNYQKIINTAINEKNGKVLCDQAHKLKGASLSVAMPKLQESVALLEKSAKNLGFHEHVVTLAKELIDEIEKAEQTLQVFFSVKIEE